MSDFKYSAKRINKIIDESGCQKADMYGVYNDLKKLKPIIEKIYDEDIFYLDYWSSECAWHGWDWSKDNGSMASMHKITGGITDKFEEIYALILAGLGERCEEQ